MTSYRVAFIGTGAVSASHLKAVQDAGERVNFIAAVGVDAQGTAAFCAANGIPHAYTDVDVMLENERPDLVHILTPPNIHADLCVRCLEAGAWVYCEKPLCASLAEFDVISAAEVRTGRYVNTVFQWRFGSAGQHLKRVMAAGELGRFLIGTCQTLWYRDEAYYRVPWRGRWTTEVGGTTMGHGIHLMDLFLWLQPDWREVQALAATLDRDVEVDTVSAALVQFDGGAVATMTNSAVSPRQETHLRLDFQRATVEVTGLYSYSNANWRFSFPDGAADSSINAGLLDRLTPPEEVPSRQSEQLRQMLDSMDKHERPAVSGDESRRILEFTASLYKSAFTRQPVTRGSITLDDPFYHAMNGRPPHIEISSPQ